MFEGWVLEVILYVNVFFIGVLVTLAIQQLIAHRSSNQTASPAEMLPKKVREEVIDDARKHYQRAVYKSAIQLDKNLADTTTRLQVSLDKLRTSIAENENKQYNQALESIRQQASNILSNTAQDIGLHQRELRRHFTEHQKSLDAKLEAEAAETERDLQRERAEYQRRQAAMEQKITDHQQALEAALTERQQKLTLTQTTIESKLQALEKLYADKKLAIESNLDQELAARKQLLASKLESELADTILAFLSESLGEHLTLDSQSGSLVKLLDEHKDEILKGLKS